MDIKGDKEAIEIKREKLCKELRRKKPNMKIVNRLEESIKRHKSIARSVRNKREKSKRKHGETQ